MLDQINADARVLRRTRARRDHDAFRLHGFDFVNRDLVVAADFDLCSEFPEILNQVVGKRIVIVENEDHRNNLSVVYTEIDTPGSGGRSRYFSSRHGTPRRNGPSRSPRVVLTEYALRPHHHSSA